jgi:hypothetical protein
MAKSEDTNRVIRRRKSKDSQYNGQKCEDTNRVIRRRKSKDSQYNGQKCEDTNRVELTVLWYAASDYPIGIFTLLAIVIYVFWLPYWYLHTLAIVLSVLWFTASDYPIGIFTLLAIVLTTEDVNQRTDNTMAKSVRIQIG